MHSWEPALSTLATEARNPRSEHIDELSTLEMLGVISDEDASVAGAVRAALPQIAEAVDAIATRFRAGGRLFYVGAGTSGRLGVLDASECPPTFSVDPGLFVGLIAGGDGALRRSSEASEDSPAQGEHDLCGHGVTAEDTVLGIAASGRTPYVLGALAYAARMGALTVALTCAGGPGAPGTKASGLSMTASPMAQAAEIAIELATGAEVLTGSTRMKAGTATKMALNMISTGVMIRQGAIYGNLMVNVQPSNAKLIDRAERIIASAAGCSKAEAEGLLRAAGDVKTAIVMWRLGIDRRGAEEALRDAGGELRTALREHRSPEAKL